MPKPIVGDCGGPGQPPCPPVPAAEPIQVPQIPGTHHNPKYPGAPQRDAPTGDDGDVKRYQDTHGHEGAK
jgi:hypothetical protein